MYYDCSDRKSILKTQVVLTRPGTWGGGLKTVVAGLITLIFILYVALKVEVFLIGYSISDAQKVQSSLLEERRSYEMNIARLKDPAQILELAKKDCGLSEPDGRIIYLE